jgi:hypothetical protein
MGMDDKVEKTRSHCIAAMVNFLEGANLEDIYHMVSNIAEKLLWIL